MIGLSNRAKIRPWRCGEVGWRDHGWLSASGSRRTGSDQALPCLCRPARSGLHCRKLLDNSAVSVNKDPVLSGKMITPIELNLDRVPPVLHPLIPFAQTWGISDDLDRELAVERASPDQLAELKAIVGRFDDQLDAWLTGDEATEPQFSNEYIAFSAMRMAADYA